jgi:hypothetical protein
MKSALHITAKVKSTLLRLSVPLPPKLELSTICLRSKFVIDNIFLVAEISKVSGVF